MEITHVLFLGLVEYRDPGENQEVERLKPEVEHLKGKLIRVDELPDGFELTASILGIFLTYKGAGCKKILFCENGGDWFNWSYNRRQTPEEFFKEHNEAEKRFAEGDPDYRPEFITFQGHAPPQAGPAAGDLAEARGDGGADRKTEGGKTRNWCRAARAAIVPGSGKPPFRPEPFPVWSGRLGIKPTSPRSRRVHDPWPGFPLGA